MPGVELGHASPKVECLPGHISEVSEVLEKRHGFVIWSRLLRVDEPIHLCPKVAFFAAERLQILSAFSCLFPLPPGFFLRPLFRLFSLPRLGDDLGAGADLTGCPPRSGSSPGYTFPLPRNTPEKLGCEVGIASFDKAGEERVLLVRWKSAHPRPDLFSGKTFRMPIGGSFRRRSDKIPVDAEKVGESLKGGV